jgi:hypothetical protein
MNNLPDNVLEQIKQLHLADRRASIKFTFELGKLILTAIVHTGLTEYKVIKLIRDSLGEMAHGTTYYNRAARIARTFTDIQQKTLVEKAVSLNTTESLAGKHYEKTRVKIIHALKTGAMKWTAIEGAKAIARKKSTMAERGIEMSDNGTISIYVRDPERMTDGFRSLLTQSSQEAVLEAINKAVAICNKSGMGLSYFSISNIKQKAG